MKIYEKIWNKLKTEINEGIQNHHEQLDHAKNNRIRESLACSKNTLIEIQALMELLEIEEGIYEKSLDRNP